MSAVTHSGVTPSDTSDLPFPSKNFYVGTTGDIKAVGVNANDQPVLFKAVAAGWWLNPWPLKRIYATGTTASNIVQHAEGAPSRGF